MHDQIKKIIKKGYTISNIYLVGCLHVHEYMDDGGKNMFELYLSLNPHASIEWHTVLDSPTETHAELLSMWNLKVPAHYSSLGFCTGTNEVAPTCAVTNENKRKVVLTFIKKNVANVSRRKFHKVYQH